MNDRTHFSDIDQLTSACQGTVFTADDEQYLEACVGWNLAWSQRPAVVVSASTETDVINAIHYATAHNLTVAVQNTGHGVTVPADDNTMLIVVKALDQVSIDPQARTATIGGGTTWAPVLTAAHEHGLAPLMGSTPHIGAVGYSLGGGLGWLARKFGMAVDAVRSLRVVLADGRVVTTSPVEEPELFWALCGTAGASLGCVVEMTVALAPVTNVYAGNLFYPLDAVEEVFERYVEWSNTAPLELTSAFNITAFPPLEMIPEPMRGKTFVIVRGCYAGTPDDHTGPGLVDSWRTWQEPLMDTWQSIPFTRSAEISMDPEDPIPAASSGRWMTGLNDTILHAMLDAMVGGESASPVLFAQTRHAGGATHGQNPAVSFAVRDGEQTLELIGLLAAPDAKIELERRFASTWQQISEHLAPMPGYLNFSEGAERIEISHQAFDDRTRERLAKAKNRYDPQDLFRHSIPLAVSQ